MLSATQLSEFVCANVEYNECFKNGQFENCHFYERYHFISRYPKIEYLKSSVVLPKNFVDVDLSSFPDCSILTKCDSAYIEYYFKYLELYHINDHISMWYSIHVCAFCKTDIGRIVYKCSCGVYVCKNCIHDDVPDYGFGKDINSIVAQYSDAKYNCLANHDLLEINTSMFFELNCDNCCEEIREPFYTDNKKLDFCADCFKIVCSNSKTNRVQIVDGRFVRPIAKKKYDKNNFVFTRQADMDHKLLEFGSIYDWVPIYTDDEAQHNVCYNANKDAKLFGTFCLTCYDDHGRQGFCAVSFSLEQLIDELLIEHKKMEDDPEYYFRTPVQALMARLGSEIEYG